MRKNMLPGITAETSPEGHAQVVQIDGGRPPETRMSSTHTLDGN